MNEDSIESVKKNLEIEVRDEFITYLGNCRTELKRRDISEAFKKYADLLKLTNRDRSKTGEQLARDGG